MVPPEARERLFDHFGNAEVRSIELSRASKADAEVAKKAGAKVPPRFVVALRLARAAKL